MTLPRRTSQAQAGWSPGGRVAGERPQHGSVLPCGSPRRAAGSPATCREHRDASRGPAALSACAEVTLRIPIAETAGLGVPSNQGMELTPDRFC